MNHSIGWQMWGQKEEEVTSTDQERSTEENDNPEKQFAKRSLKLLSPILIY